MLQAAIDDGYNSALRLESSNADAWTGVGEACLQQGRLFAGEPGMISMIYQRQSAVPRPHIAGVHLANNNKGFNFDVGAAQSAHAVTQALPCGFPLTYNEQHCAAELASSAALRSVLQQYQAFDPSWRPGGPNAMCAQSSKPFPLWNSMNLYASIH